VDVAVVQAAAFQHAELFEQEESWVKAGLAEMPVPGSAFLIAMSGTERAFQV